MDEVTDLTSIKGVGEALLKKFNQLGIYSVDELINYYPRKYDDFSKVDTISQLHPGIVTIKADVKQVTGRYVRRGMHITEAVASDETGSVRLVWFNQPYRATAIKPHTAYYIRGEFALRRQRLSIMNPSMELVSDFPIHTARILPTYKTIKGVTSQQIRKVMANVASTIVALPETLPRWVVEDNNLVSRAAALECLHFPKQSEDVAKAKERLGFEEVFHLTLAALLNKQELSNDVGISIVFDQEKAKSFVTNLPFQLTDAQRKVIWQIYKDMEKGHPMNRLLEGDVGSGKTVVACMAALMVINAGYQVALMAPTELLARQHANTLLELLRPVGLDHSVTLLVGGMNAKQKKQAHEDIQEGRSGFIVGTHALIQDSVVMHKLGLVIIDEQHRFGVDQRKKLQAKAGYMPHMLSMTATPIPRSLALTLYGELDISIIEDKPADRLPVITSIVSPNSVEDMYANLEKQVRSGRQAFIVCTLVSESEMMDIKSAEMVYETVRKGRLKQHKIGLLHGKMKSADKERVMKQFTAKKLDILVCTTVIEVGVDVPNATVMIIENADRFGLAQIHQLRGRVGRSKHQGYCYLVMSDSGAPTKRIRALETTNDGFKLAELDLELRGPGAIYGLSQHGVLDLRIAKLSDTQLIARARSCAQEFIDRKENLLEYKQLNAHIQKLRTVTNLN